MNRVRSCAVSRRWPIAILVVAAGATPAAAVASPVGPAARVEAFLAAYASTGSSGLPDAAQLDRLRPYLAPRLARLLADARAAQARYAAAHPGDKPPLIEGDLFSSLFEGPQRFRAVESGNDKDGRDWVLIEFRRADPRAGQPDFVWHDRYWLARAASGAGPAIDDVEYLGQWDFANKGTLSDALRQAAALAR